jgi:hypothetical protein
MNKEYEDWTPAHLSTQGLATKPTARIGVPTTLWRRPAIQGYTVAMAPV